MTFIAQCSCGRRFHSPIAEARHRHNFPALCQPKRAPGTGITLDQAYAIKQNAAVLIKTRTGWTQARFVRVAYAPYRSPKSIVVSDAGRERYIPFAKVKLPEAS